MKLGTQHYLVNIIVLIWLEFKIIVICLKLRAKLRFYEFLSYFGTFSHKVAQTQFFLHETWPTILFGKYYCLEVVRIKIIVLYQKLRVKIRFYGLLSFFGSFAHNVAQTWFVFHETLHTTLFGIYYFVEVVRIVYHSDILNISR